MITVITNLKSLTMKLSKIKGIVFIATVCFSTALHAREIRGIRPSNTNEAGAGLMKTAGGCAQPTAKITLDINNVRTTILNGDKLK